VRLRRRLKHTLERIVELIFVGSEFRHMSYPIRTIQIQRGQHRLYEIINTFAISQAALSIALYARLGLLDQLKPPGTFKATMACSQFNQGVSTPIIGPLDYALEGRTASAIVVAVETPSEPEWISVQSSTTPGRQLNDIVRKQLTPHFVEFYEDYVVWLEQNVNPDFTKWPAIWQFGRRVRDAISHGGKITINNPQFVPVTWYNLTYGPSQNGRLIFQDDLSTGDVFVLLLEMSECLDGLNCPLAAVIFVMIDANRMHSISGDAVTAKSKPNS